MKDFEDDEALARLRAADPASGAHPDLHRISQRLRGRTPLGADPQGYSFSDSSDIAVHVHDPGVRTGRGGLLVAAAVASLALGAGGYALGATTTDDPPPSASDSSDSDKDDTSPREFDGPASAGAESMSEAETDGGGMGAADEAMGGNYAGPVIPVAGEGLSTERTTGPVYGTAQSAEGSAAEVLGQYAEGLGIEGDVQDEQFSAWVVDAGDGRHLNVYQQGGSTSVDYSDPAIDPWCGEMKEEWARSGVDGGMGMLGPGGPSPDSITCAETGPAPDEATAIATVQDFLGDAGIDFSDYTFTVEPMFGYPEAYSGDSAYETADGAYATSAPDESMMELPSDEPTVSVNVSDGSWPVEGYRSWHFSVTSAGVAYGYFQLGDVVELGEYPVISPAEAVERATDVKFQQLGAYIPELEYPGYMEEWVEPQPLPPISAGDPIPYPVSESAVTKVELHTGIISLWDGTEYMVPVYDLADGKGNRWQVLGLAEDALDFTP